MLITDGKKRTTQFPERQQQMKRLELELYNKAWMTYWEKEDFAGSDMWYKWITSAYHSKYYTGRFQNIREDQVGRKQTGGTRSTKTCKRRVSPGRKQRWQLLTDKNGVKVWRIVSTWMLDDSVYDYDNCLFKLIAASQGFACNTVVFLFCIVDIWGHFSWAVAEIKFH